jgi:putative ABC transport system permease protein
MDFFEEIWATISKNRSRSILTGFGVFWGMMMLLVLVGIGQSLTQGIMANVEGFAINSCFVIPDRTSKPYKGLQKGRTWAIHNSDMHTIRQAAKHAEEVAPMCFGDQSMVRFGNWHEEYNIVGITSNYPDILYIPLLYGREINDIDVAEKRKVCVIGNEVYCKLFPEGGDPTGKLLHVGSMQFRIVGVKTKSKSQVSINGHPDQQLLWPISTLQQAYQLGENIHLIMATAQPNVAVSIVEEELKTILKELYTIAPDDNRAMYTVNMEETLKAFKYLVVGLSALIWLIGLGTLISGAVGVSNIMLVTVRERTKEIGIRRAIGASPWVITKQILAESTLLTLLAGLLGIVAAVGVLQIAQQLLQGNEMFSQDMQISFGIAIGGLVILLVIGLLAGLLPARRALAIKPIEALNEE